MKIQGALLLTVLLYPQLKEVNGVIYECLPGRYEECGTGPLIFRYDDNGAQKYLVKYPDHVEVITQDELNNVAKE